MDIIVDIDGTIADCRHRRYFVIDGKHDWKSFFESMIVDPPIQPVIDLVNELSIKNTILLATGRSEEYMRHTVDWLYQHKVQYARLYMRRERDCRPDQIVKKEILDQMIKEGYKPKIALDDRQTVVDMWRENNIICLQNCMKEMP